MRKAIREASTSSTPCGVGRWWRNVICDVDPSPSYSFLDQVAGLGRQPPCDDER